MLVLRCQTQFAHCLGMKNYDLLIHALFTASVGDAARAMSIEDEQHNKKSILTHPFFHMAFPAGEELAIMMMMIAIIKEAFRRLYIIYRDQKNWAKMTFNLLPICKGATKK